MATHFKDLYRRYMEKGLPSSDLREFKKELDHIPDEELWNTMINMEKDSAPEIGMPPMMKKQIRKELHQIIWRRRWYQFAKYAAVIALLVTSSFGIYSLFDTPSSQQMITANVKPGSKSEIILPDGTKVQLNGATTIRYDINDTEQRLVHLSGEAFFDVAKNPDCPFRVMVNDFQIEVLGTSFNVQDYPENKDIVVCLDEGNINLTLPTEKKYPVQPGERLVYNKDNQQCTISKMNDMQRLSMWKQNVIVFKDTPLPEVIKILNRWYNVEFKVEDENVLKYVYTLTSDNTLLEKVLMDLEKIAPVKFEYNEDKKEVIVKMK